MEKMLLVSKNLTHIGCRLDFYLISDEYADMGSNVFTEIYGVEVQKVCRDEIDVEYIQKRTIYDLSCDKSKVVEFIHLLSENEVTPVTLYDIVSDQMEEGYFESENYLIDQPA